MTKHAQRLLLKTGFVLFAIVSTILAYAQTTTIRGSIKDPNGLPLQGASVTIEGTRKGVVTDANGNFSIAVEPGNYTVVISYVGHQTQRQTVSVPAGGLTDLNYNLQSGGDLNRVVVVGSRSSTVRSSTQTPVPVDVISARDMQATGQIEPTQMLNFIAPSYNSSRQTIADGTDHIDPATLRGLGPDQVLVLVNGRRRYNTALLNVNGTIGRGSVGTDLNSLPPAAIERIEVLRDGASSQYGSDAIGGVINVVLKKNNVGTTLFGHTGKYFAGDGATQQLGLTQGLKLGKQGFLTLSGDFRYRNPTNRVGDYRGRVYVSDSLQDEQIIAQRGFSRKNNMAIGNSRLVNIGVVANGGVPISPKTQLFFTGGWNDRDGKAAGFYRYPSQTSQVIAALYPDGFLPYINSNIRDRSGIIGLQGKMGGWDWDISQTSGGNSFRFEITNTNNASQFALGKDAPTEFYAGTLKFNQHISNLNFSRDFAGKMGGVKTFNLAFGAEVRFDNYQILPGEEASWRNFEPTSGRVGGAQVFPGFQPANAVDEWRNVQGVYIDLESDVNDKFLYNAAVRFENYSDFGSNFAGKLALRYKVADPFTIRAAVSNGFRAPSMHQRYFSAVSTVFVSNGTTLVPVQNGTFRNNSELALSFGIPSLEAEKSMNYSAGFTSRFGKGWNATIDGYMIDIRDRIVLTGTFTKSSPVVAQLLANYPDVNSAAFFTNAIDTRTKGIDAVISKNSRVGKANLILTLAANFNETEVTESKPLPAQLASDPTLKEGVLFDREQRRRMERGQPRSKITLGANYQAGRIQLNVRSTRFGKVATADRLNPLLDEEFDPRIVTDASIGLKISNFATVTVGANNIGDVYPERLEQYGNTSFGRFLYSRAATQFGFNGGYYYVAFVLEVQNLINRKK